MRDRIGGAQQPRLETLQRGQMANCLVSVQWLQNEHKRGINTLEQ